jgi:hypothetical protein
MIKSTLFPFRLKFFEISVGLTYLSKKCWFNMVLEFEPCLYYSPLILVKNYTCVGPRSLVEGEAHT